MTMHRSRRKIRLVDLPCPRCGHTNKTLGEKPGWASAESFGAYRGVCPGCLTPGEAAQILGEMTEALRKGCPHA